MLQTFLPLFLMTFGICLFIVLMQFLWRYIDDMVGKGLEISVLMEMFWYAALTLVPMALPLAILLASLMTFGNLGERFELLAMKAAGVSLIRIMRPLIIFIAMTSVGAFFFQNNVMPVVQVKLYGLLYSIRQKSPELDIPEGAFSNDIPGYNVYVKSKDRDTGRLNDVMIYDYSADFNNARVYVADSGRMKVSADKLFLVLKLYEGESFENLKQQPANARGNTVVPYRRETFSSKEVLIEFDANFNRGDDSFLQNNYMGKNLKSLQSSIDSMELRLDSIKHINGSNIYNASYRRTFLTVRDNEDKQTALPDISGIKKEKFSIINFDSLYQAETPSGKATLLARAKAGAENVKQDYTYRALTLGDEASRVRRHYTEWHKKFTVSFACLVFFFIGAPLGAIIRKGGLGVPVIISVFLFIFYYIIDNIGFKLAREGVWPAWEGMWLSSVILAPLGIFLTYKAVNDSVILNADTYLNAFKKLIGKRTDRKVEMKEVIIFNPDYEAVKPRLNQLITDCSDYLAHNRRWISYISYWKQGAVDAGADKIVTEVEDIVEELANSDQILLLNKLMDYPITNSHKLFNFNITPKAGMIIALLFPIGLPVYLLAVHQRKLLLHDIKTVQRTSEELLDIIE